MAARCGRPDGVTLSWRYTDPARVIADGVIPFFIDWGQSPHPSGSAAGGALLVDFRAEQPDVTDVQRMLRVLNLDVAVSEREKAALEPDFTTSHVTEVCVSSVEGNPAEIRELARYEVRREALDQCLAAIHEFVGYVRTNESGALRYEVWQEVEHPTRFIHIFIWRDAEATWSTGNRTPSESSPAFCIPTV